MRRYTLIPSGVSPGEYGDAANVPVVAVDAMGRIRRISEAAIAPAGSGSGGSTGAEFTAPPAASGFSWDNQGSATLTDANGGLLFTVPANGGTSIRVAYKSAPATPYKIETAFFLNAPGVDYLRAGLAFRQSSDGKIVYHALGYSGKYGYFGYKFTNATGFSGTYNDTGWLPVGGLWWLRIGDSGTNRTVELSADGWNWFEIHSVSRTDFLTADQIGLCVDSNNATYGVKAQFMHWKQL